MRKLVLYFMFELAITATFVGCAADPPMHARAPHPHPPAALDMRGDCMTPPCGPGGAPQSGFWW